MDLGAYANIELLEQIMKDNGIEVPRLRGLRLMKTEDAIDINKYIAKNYIDVYECEDLVCGDWNFVSGREYSDRTRRMCEHYMVRNKECSYPRYTAVRWERIHGKKRKRLKFAIKKKKKRIVEQWTVWNKYAGQENVLYIHARIGGYNWPYYGGEELEKQPWFLEKVDDLFDSTYCDIYARIKPSD